MHDSEYRDLQIFSPAASEVLIIKSVTHRDFNAMIKVKIFSQKAVTFLNLWEVVQCKGYMYIS